MCSLFYCIPAIQDPKVWIRKLACSEINADHYNSNSLLVNCTTVQIVIYPLLITR